MSASALLLAPPLLKYTAGPLLGPAMLKGAAEAAGHRVRVLDLNIRYLREQIRSWPTLSPEGFVGDHAKPGDVVREVEVRFADRLREILPAGAQADSPLTVDPIIALTCGHDEIEAAAQRLASSSDGNWLSMQLLTEPRPELVGISVMFSGQVLWGLAASLIARRVWPGVPVVWGGAHVTALRDEIAQDSRYGRFIDGFVFGYAERTFVGLLQAIADGVPWPAEFALAGSKRMVQGIEDIRTIPSFEDLMLFGPNLTLPVQTSRGCGFGLCTFCTYPGIEGRYRELPLDALSAVVGQARRLGAAVSLKDSLVVPHRLIEVARIVEGRVPWSACTKLNGLLDAAFLRRLSQAGCRTLEFGLETLVPRSQELIRKKQDYSLFTQTLDAAAEVGVALVINYITGFPGEDPKEAEEWLDRARDEMERRRPRLRAKLEHNAFELERLAPLARSPVLTITTQWPWSSLLGWCPTERIASSMFVQA